MQRLNNAKMTPPSHPSKCFSFSLIFKKSQKKSKMKRKEKGTGIIIESLQIEIF
jgi:hypothetical protein